ncbi:MAG: amino acid ABC transporter ATP-binding protein [Microlunatus sp.]
MIVFEGVHKSFGNTLVLNGINARLARGQVGCLIGPSGSGKSTMLRCVNGLERHESGCIRIDDIVVDARSTQIHKLRTRVSMVFQRFNLFPHRTVLENVMEGPLYVLKEERIAVFERAQGLLARVGLADKANAYPASLSGGQQQRVAIARALAMRPEIILFDEPTSALDPEMVGEVLNVMRGLAEVQMTMLIVTHEIQFAREAADIVFFLDGGRILEQGDAKQVLKDPSHERTRDFLKRVMHQV